MDSVIIQKQPLGYQWPTQEPFLFCVHHLDHFPKGNGQYGPDEHYLNGREIGSDFVEKDGFRMYHGETIPGFPVHPHRGFETITIVRQGYADHADSMGAAGRYGEGDVQWMTAGKGVQHSEMFPLLRTDSTNTVELFQIWINLPRKSKMVEPYFKMLWNEKIPRISIADQGEITLIAGQFNQVQSHSAPPNSWAVDPQNETLILIAHLKKNQKIILPETINECSRSLYFYKGSSIKIHDEVIFKPSALFLKSKSSITIEAVESDIEFLLLQSRPIGEPVVQYGPFVMNTKEEIIKTFEEYQKTQFGGWKWPMDGMVHGPKIERFAQYPNGQIELP